MPDALDVEATALPEVVEGDTLCSCPGFEYRGTCSHARKLKAALGGGGALPAGYSAAGVELFSARNRQAAFSITWGVRKT